MAADRQEIAAQLRDSIARGDYASGHKLPSTRELAELFDAAQNTVSEALRILATEGVVTVQGKKRAVVRTPTEDSPSSEERLSAMTHELTSVQDELRQVRAQVTALEQRVAGLINDNPAR